MLTRTKLRALSPGKWARVIVPDYECWKKTGGAFYEHTKPGDEVDICLVPWYCPRYDSQTCFHWVYRVAYRRPGSSCYPTYQRNDGCWLGEWDFGLVECTKYHYDSKEQRDLWDGKGKLLYHPVSDDRAICPGGDYSIYTCSICGEVVKPFSNDEGELICPYCEATGLVVMDDEQLDRIEQVREFARSIGKLAQFESQLDYLAGYGANGEPARKQCMLGYDFASHSFGFCLFTPAVHSSTHKRERYFNGGLIFSGQGSPNDGSFPALTVSLSSHVGWFCHT